MGISHNMRILFFFCIGVLSTFIVSSRTYGNKTYIAVFYVLSDKF